MDNDYPFSKNYIWRVGDVPAKDGVNVGNDVNEAIEAGVKLYESYDELREDCPEKTRYTLSLEYWNSIKDNFDNVLPYWRNYGGGYSDYSESNYGDYYSILYYKTRAYYFSSMGDRIDPVGANHYYLSKYDNDEEWTKQNQSGYASYYNLGDIHWEWNDFTSGDINITYDVVFPGCKFPNNYDDLSADTEYRKNAIDYYKQYTDYKYYMGYAEAISEPYTGERHYQEDWVESVYWRRQKEKNIVKKIAQALEATTQKPQYSSFYKEDGVTYFEDKYDDLIAFTYDDENFYHVNYDMINCKEVYEENNIWYFVNDNYKYYIKDGLEYYEYPGYTYYKDANGQYHTIYPQGNDVENKKNNTSIERKVKQNKIEQDKAEQDKEIEELYLSGISQKIAAGKKLKLEAQIVPLDATNQTLKWTSSNTKYATVSSNGVVTTKKKGVGKNVIIEAATQDGSGIVASYRIKIVKHALKAIKLKAKSKTVNVGKKLAIKATVKTTGKTANKALQWSSSNTEYATVSESGVVTAKEAGRGKIVKIIARATDGTGKKAVIKIKIK